MKKKRSLNIKIHLTNRWLYTFIFLGILLLIGVGVYASLGTTPNPGHPVSELQSCSDGEILQMVSGAWACADVDLTGGISSCSLQTTSATASRVLNSASNEQEVIVGCPGYYTLTACSGGVYSNGAGGGYINYNVVDLYDPGHCRVRGDVAGLGSGAATVTAYCTKVVCS
jgi:hypothetical protein